MFFGGVVIAVIIVFGRELYSICCFGVRGNPVASSWTVDFNLGLSSVLQSFGTTHADINLYFVDAFSMFQQYPVGSPEWSSLFWFDGFHPSSIGHEMMFQTAQRVIDPVPEPATMALPFLFSRWPIDVSSRASVLH